MSPEQVQAVEESQIFNNEVDDYVESEAEIDQLMIEYNIT